MSDFKARKIARIAEAAAGTKFRFSVVSNHYAFATEEIASFSTRPAAEAFIGQKGSIVGHCQALEVFAGRHRNDLIPSGMTFKIVRQAVAA